MIRYNRELNKYEFYNWKVYFKENGIDKVEWALPSKEWWKELENKHSHVEILQFEQIPITSNHQQRFNNIKNFVNYNWIKQYILDELQDYETEEGVVTKQQIENALLD